MLPVTPWTCARARASAGLLLALSWFVRVAAQTAPAEGPRAPTAPVARLAPLDPAGATFRLYEGLTLLIHNPDGRAFQFALDVRDLNLTEPGPREVLFKLYDPDGKAVVREVIPDDGVTTPASQIPTGGWDHEGWYYIYQYNRGVAPMLRWSALAAPDRVAATPVRTLTRAIPAGPKGVYRVVLVGARDHVVTIKLDPALAWAVGGNPYFLHPVGNVLAKRFIYVPKGAAALNLAIVEHDRPRARAFVLRDHTGKTIAEGGATAGVGFYAAKPEKPGDWDDQVFTFELNEGPNACLVQCSLMFPKLPGNLRALPSAIPAFYAPDAATAKAVQGGAIYQGDLKFWLPQQAKLDAWLKTLPPEEFEPKGADGKPAARIKIQNNNLAAGAALDLQPNRNKEFVPLNGEHEGAPLCDTIMFSYDLHHNRQALNLALRDLALCLNTLNPNDHVVNATWKGMANLAYEFGTYRFHAWRPAWRILQEKDTPEPARALIRELVTNAADRLAFCRNWERVNGNAFATVVCGLRYAYAGTGDPLNEQLFSVFYERFTTGGWGDRVGLGPSGAVQEEFAYDQHYGSYPLNTWGPVVQDLKDPRFIKVHNGLRNFYSFTYNDDVAACPFSARTFHNPNAAATVPTEGPYIWKGLPGPDLTESVNGGNEFFAARRAGYYVLSYHGRITPKWEGESFRGQMGWSGGVLCQLVVPGKGTVLASTLEGPGYGTNMHPSQWRSFRLHTIAGVTADGKPLVAADGEHLNARLVGNTVTGSGEVRDSSVVATRSYTYNADHVVVEASLRLTDDEDYLNFWFKSPFRGHLCEAWEMVPFLARQRTGPGGKGNPGPTVAKVLDAAGKEVGELGDALLEGQTVVLDRGGFGVRLEFEQPRKVKRGTGHTVMIQLVPEAPIGPRDDKVKPNVGDAAIRYKLVPFGQ